MSSLLVFPSHFNLFGQRNKNTENPIIETVLFLGSIAKEIMMIIFLAFSLMIFWLKQTFEPIFKMHNESLDFLSFNS